MMDFWSHHGVSTSGSHSQDSANHSQAAASSANEVLRELRRLRAEMKMLLRQPEDLLMTTRPAAPSQSQQTQSKPSQSQQTHSQFKETYLGQTESQQVWPALVQRRPMVPSVLEEAGRVLHRVQRQRKVLKENLEALLRVKTGEVLHCQLEALAANRDWTEEVHIKKTVDTWIKALTSDMQAEMSTEDTISPKPSTASRSHAHCRDGRGRPTTVSRATGSKVAMVRGSRGQMDRMGGQTAGRRKVQKQGAEPERDTGRARESEVARASETQADAYLTRLYGRAPYEGIRRTLKKSPYLRFSSPASPRPKKPRPRLLESIRGF
ncbi:hypothetical protein LDENG_00139910, partial [Lucifuga dentata]